MTIQRSFSDDTIKEETLSQAAMRRQRTEEAHEMRHVLIHEIYSPLMEILRNLEQIGAAQLFPEVRECRREILDCAQRVNFAIKELEKLDQHL